MYKMFDIWNTKQVTLMILFLFLLVQILGCLQNVGKPNFEKARN